MTDRGDFEPGGTPSASDGRRLKLAVLVIVGVLAVVTSLVLARAVLVDSDGASEATTSVFLDDAHHDDAATSDGNTGSTGAAAGSVGNRLSRCAAADRNLAEALDHARPALDQWSVHVGAMNKLVVGEITLEQASAFWSSTRAGAARRVSEFRDVMSDLRARGLDCPSVHYLAPGSRVLPGCIRRVTSEVRALGAARTAMGTWEHHIHDMEMLRLGELSPEDATAAWLSMWQEGMRELDAYDAAVADVEQQGACARRTSSQ